MVPATPGQVHSPSFAPSPSREAPLSFAKNRPLFSCPSSTLPVCLSVCASCPPPRIRCCLCGRSRGAEEQRALVPLGRPSVRPLVLQLLPSGQLGHSGWMDALWYKFSMGSRRGESSGGGRAESSTTFRSECWRGGCLDRESRICING